MPRVLKDLKIMLLANFWLVPVLAALVAALFYFVAPPPPMHASLATGSASGGYHAFGEKLRDELAREGFTLTLINSEGSRDNLDKLRSNEAQLALVQSGQELTLPTPERDALLGLGVMYQEPLWLFVRSAQASAHFQDLLDQRVAIGTPGSGSGAVIYALLEANRITPDQYPESWQAIGGKRAADALIAGELDAGFFLGPAENALIQRLASDPNLHLIGLGRSAAYMARLPYLNRLEVGEGLLDLASNTPDRDIITLGPSATLLANGEFHASLTPLILAAAREVLKDGNLLDAADQYPAAPPRTLKTLGEAEYFYKNGLPILQRYLPFRIASLADRYIILAIPLLVLLFPLIKAIGPLYRWRIRARIYRWYKHLREIDRQLHDGTLPAHLDEEIQRLESLEAEMDKIDVPLSYSSELYELHMHLRYVIERLQALRQSRATTAATVG